MKIIMLGHSGVGKTTYMASMYGSLQNTRGFGLRAENWRVHETLLAAAEQIGNGCYPPPTDQRTKYKFKLTFDGKPFFKFKWVDYRGGALLEGSSSRDAAALTQDLSGADGILMFIDGAQVLHRSTSFQVGRMMSLIAQAIDNLDHQIPLAIVITKSDRIEDHPNLRRQLVSTLSGLRAAVEASDKTFGAFIPVSCGRLQRHVHLPVLFTLNIAIRALAIRLSGRIQEHTTRQAYFTENAGIFDDIVSNLLSVKSHRNLASEEYMKARQASQALEPLLAPAEALQIELADLEIF